MAPAPLAPAPEPEKKFVRIVPLKLESAPQLVIESNVAVGEPIHISVKGEEGKILEFVRFQRSTQIARAANEVPTLDLSKWNFPSGQYSVEAKGGDVTAVMPIFIGQKGPKFEKALAVHQKKVVAQKKAEKKELVAALKKLEGLSGQIQKNYSSLKKTPAKWTAFYKKWTPQVTASTKGLINSFKTPQADRYYYSKTIEGTRGAVAELVRTARSFNEAVKNKRSPAATNDMKSVQQQLKQLRESL